MYIHMMSQPELKLAQIVTFCWYKVWDTSQALVTVIYYLHFIIYIFIFLMNLFFSCWSWNSSLEATGGTWEIVGAIREGSSSETLTCRVIHIVSYNLNFCDHQWHIFVALINFNNLWVPFLCSLIILSGYNPLHFGVSCLLPSNMKIPINCSKLLSCFVGPKTTV